MSRLPGEKEIRRCRYCGAPMADEERFCDGCGMASFGAEDMRARAGRTRDEAAQAEQSVPCRSCGTPVTGKRCPGCGTRKPDSEL